MKEVVINVGVEVGAVQQRLAAVTKSLADLKSAQKDTKKEMEATGDAAGKLSQQYAAQDKQIKQLTAEQKALTGQLQTTITSTDELGDSFRELDAYTRSLENQYKSLTKAQRESAEGQEMKASIIDLKQQLQDFDAELGNHQRNVGNYPKAWESALPGLNAANGFLGKMGTSMQGLASGGKKAFAQLGQSAKAFGKTMITPPVGIITAILSAIVLVINKVKEAFQRNDDAMTKVQKAFAVFTPIVEAVRKVMEGLANIVAKVVEGVANAAKAVLSLIPGFNDAANAAQNLIDKQDRLQEQERQFTVESARRQKEIARLRDEAIKSEDGYSESLRTTLKINEDVNAKLPAYIKNMTAYKDTMNALAQADGNVNALTGQQVDALKEWGLVAEETNKVRVKTTDLIQEAIDLEEKEFQDKVDIARQKREIYEQQMKQDRDYSDERKDELANLKAAEINAEAEYYNHKRKLEKEQRSREESDQKKAEEASKKAIENAKKAAAVRLEIERALQDALIAVDTDAVSRQVNQVKVAGEREVENLKIKLNNLKKTDIKAREDLQKLIEAKERETQQAIDKILLESAQQRAQALRENQYNELALLTSDAEQLLQFKKAQAQEALAELQEMTDEQRTLMFESEEEYDAAVLAARKQLADDTLALQQEQYARQQQAEQNEYERKLQNIQEGDAVALAEAELARAEEEHEALLNMDQQTKYMLFKTEEDYAAAVIAAENKVTQNKKKAVEEQRKMAMSNAKAIGDAMGSLSDLLDQYGEKNASAAKASKAIALGKIAVDTGVAIAGGIAQAQSVPFPANIAAIATTVATIIANMASAISTVKDAKFATGGIVGGTSYTGDQVPARLNSREMVLNLDQQQRLFDGLNGTGDGSLGVNYEAMAAVVAAQPAPVMVYTEFEQFGQKVADYTELAKIG